MAQARLSVRKIREVLRLKAEARLSDRQIAAVVGSARSTVQECLSRARAAGLTWPLPPECDEEELHARLYPRAAVPPRYPTPDFTAIHAELARKGVTRMLLWQEYKARHPDGCQYSAFCRDYDAWLGRQDAVMRFEHTPGERLFVDYAGLTMSVVDRHSGAVQTAQIFVAALGASHYTYVEATLTQSRADWLGAHVRAFEYFGGVTELVVIDNLKSGVQRACRYEPDLNPSYQDLAEHYGVAVLPARVRKPRDKAKVEVGVQVVERWMLARLRHRPFFALAELNQALRGLLEQLNQRRFKKLPGTRQQWFETLERPALRPLPAEPYEFARWKKARVNIDYHIDVERHYYSVPYLLVRQEVDVRLTAATVEVFHHRQRVASHRRDPRPGRYTTVAAHMPKAHREYAEWTPARLVRWAEQTGPSTAALVERILATRPHPQQGYRSCLGILRLGQTYGTDRLEAACRRALAIGGFSYKSVDSILKRGLDQQPLPDPVTPTEAVPAPTHANLRGPAYYH